MVAAVPVKLESIEPATSRVASVPVKLELIEPATSSVAAVPVKEGVDARAAEAAVITVVSLEVGSVTAVGVLGVKLPAVQAIVRFSLLPSGVKVRVGIVAEAAEPAVTEPAVANSAIVAVVGVTVTSGLLTEPAGV